MRKILAVIICILISGLAFGQKTKKAEKAYEEGNYALAIEEYTLLTEQTDDSQLRAQFRYYIGESYRKMNRPDRAEKPLADAIKGGYMSGDVYRSLAEVQLKLGKYDDALSSFESYKRSNPSDPLADIGIASCKFAKENDFINPFFEVKPLDRVNSGKSEIGVSYFNDGLIFSSTRAIVSNTNDDEDDEKEDKKEVYSRTGLVQAKVFMSSGNNGTFGRAIEVTELNKMKDFSNDGVFSYDPYSRQGFYARNDGKKSYIQFMEYKSNKWVKKDKIDVESKKFPIGHPFITPDGNRIYFTSTMPGGYGKSDIWYIERSGKGWTNPINAGEQVNTAGNEVYPVIAGDYLFFASDGHVGFGGFDIFASKMDGYTPQKPQNLGHPFNTHADDYNIAIRSDMEEGVLISGRNARRQDDVYYFKGFPFAIIASGKVTDAQTGKPISNVTIELIEEKGNKTVNKITTDLEGNYSFFIAPEQKYIIKASVAGHSSNTRNLTTDANRFARLNNLDLSLTSNASVISGRVYSRSSFMAVENQDVTLFSNGKALQTVKTNFDGVYKFGDVKSNTQYTIRVSPEGYFAESKEFSTGTITQNTEFNKANGVDNDFALESVELNKEIIMNLVDFEKGQTNLLPESTKELERYADIFKKNPNCQILITSYTDSRSSAKNATDLTNKRAEVIKSFFVSRGVNANQLTTKGMGRSKLLISNARTEDEHRRNNRVSYTVTKIDKSSQPTTTTTTTTQPVTNTRPTTTTQPATTGSPGTTTQTTTTTTTTQPTTPATGSNYASLPWRIQVMAIKKQIKNDPLFVKIKSQLGMEVHEAIGADGFYRYYVGGFNTREEAAAASQRLKAINIDCMVKPSSAF